MTEQNGEDPADENAYAVLGVAADAAAEEIRARYFASVRSHSPERDPEGFKRIRKAYEQLRSPRKRAELTLLELRQGDAELDVDRLRDTPAPAFPAQWLEHVATVALAALDARLDAAMAARMEAIRQRYGKREEE